MAKKKETDQIKGTFADRNQIFCADCIFRDKTVINLGKKEIPVGVTKGNCDMYVYPNCKPDSVLFQNEPCDYFEPEE